jgi:hypothetical protein
MNRRQGEAENLEQSRRIDSSKFLVRFLAKKRSSL